MYHFQKEFDKTLDDLLKSGKVSPRTSGWASPLRLVGIKDGGARITVDYKTLNNITEKIAYPLPIIDEIFNNLANAVYYTVLDLRSAYYQVVLHPDSRKYSAFICSRGLFEFNVLPQGAMNIIFEDLLHKFVETYLDDIIIFSNSLKEHVQHVKIVVDRLIKYVLKIRLDKCKIAEQRIEYLSHIIQNGCIQPNPQKIKDLLKYEPPLTQKKHMH